MEFYVASALALLAGAALSTQIGINVHLRMAVGHPVVAGFISFLVGAVALGAYALGARLPVDAPGLLRAPWWAWTGGVLGAYYVGSAIVLGPRLGATVFVVLVVTGQLVTALVIDQLGWLGTTPQPVSAWRLAGVALVLAGVIVSQRH